LKVIFRVVMLCPDRGFFTREHGGRAFTSGEEKDGKPVAMDDTAS
jgi:hypothetical protein